MKFLMGNRGSGVTTDLILESSQFNRPILTLNRSLANHLKDTARIMGTNIPEPIALNDLEHTYKGRNLQEIDKILIDRGEIVLETLLREKGITSKISTIGLTFSCGDEK